MTDAKFGILASCMHASVGRDEAAWIRLVYAGKAGRPVTAATAARPAAWAGGAAIVERPQWAMVATQAPLNGTSRSCCCSVVPGWSNRTRAPTRTPHMSAGLVPVVRA